MTATKARKQLDRLIDTIQQTEIKTLERQRKRLAAYVDNHEADLEEDTDIAAVIRELENYVSDRAKSYITHCNSIGKILTGRDIAAEFAADGGLPYVECEAE